MGAGDVVPDSEWIGDEGEEKFKSLKAAKGQERAALFDVLVAWLEDYTVLLMVAMNLQRTARVPFCYAGARSSATLPFGLSRSWS